MGNGEKEVRLAIVMNGGVSLAVWMGGVAHEIDLLRRASRVARGATEAEVGEVCAHDRGIFDKWVEFCTAHDVGDVVVDVVAGTSAGGLNGTLLATAIARGVPLDPLSDTTGPWLRGLWVQDATLENGKLLRSSTGPPLPSVFDGDFFTSTIERAFRAMSAPAGRQARPEPVTLFVTATALGRSDRHFRDSFMQPFDISDHRRLYRFLRSDAEAVSYASPDGDESGTPDAAWWEPSIVDAFAGDARVDAATARSALVTAARASASFPFAFAPVREVPELAARRVLPPSAVEPEGGRWLVDGGILDNAPFQPVLDAITRRPLTQPVRRLLLYVVPSGGTSAQPAEAAPAMPAWEPIGGAVIGFPSESDIRDDMTMAEDLVTRAEGRTAAPEARFRDSVEGDGAMLSAAVALLPQYRAARVVGGLLEVRATLAAARPSLATTLAPRSVEDAENLLGGDVPWIPAADGDPRSAYDEDAWRWGLAAAERVVRLMVRDLRTRFASAGETGPDHLAVISTCLNRIEAVRDAFRAAVIADADTAPAGDAALVAWTAERFTTLRVKLALAWCVRTAADAYASALHPPGGAAGAVSSGLAVEVSTQAFTAYQPFTRTAPFQLLRLGPDVETPLVDRGTADADAARAVGARKLYGTRLRHFAAFGLPAWRHWDWCAGRLDAQTHLARARAAPDGDDAGSIRSSADAWVAEVQAMTVEAELDLDGPAWQKHRASLAETADAALLAELREDPAGDDLAMSVVDAAMRALPHQQALGRTGLVLNSLFARRPQRPRAAFWTRLARPFTRSLWRRKVASLGRRRK
jgi:predicted acylesterase/phospholipase RssA